MNHAASAASAQRRPICLRKKSSLLPARCFASRLAFLPASRDITAFITAQDGNLPLEIFGGVLAGVAFAVSVYRGSAGYAFAGGVGLFAFVLDIEFRYFQSSLGFAVSLVISGLVLLGIALLLARLLPRLRR